MSTIPMPDGKEIVARFERESGVSLTTIHSDPKMAESIVRTVYVLGFRDGVTAAFDLTESVLRTTKGS